MWIHLLSLGLIDGAGGGVVGNRLKQWNGSSWESKTLKYWNGSLWTTKTLKYWNGITWM